MINISDYLSEKRKDLPINIYSSKRNLYPELCLFKNRIESEGKGPLQMPYTSIKSTVFLYRIIFLSIGILYFFLGAILFTKSLTWTCALIFGSSFAVKTILCSLSALTSIYCIATAFLMKSEHEAVKKAFRRSKRHLQKIYERKAVQYGINSTFSFGNEYKKTQALKQFFWEALEKLQEQKDEALFTLERIADDDSFEQCDKERLFNQTVLELKDKMDLVIACFKTTSPSL